MAEGAITVQFGADNKRLAKPETLDKSIFHECPLVGSDTGKGVVADKSIREKFAALNYKNFKFQFNRVVRSKLPF